MTALSYRLPGLEFIGIYVRTYLVALFSLVIGGDCKCNNLLITYGLSILTNFDFSFSWLSVFCASAVDKKKTQLTKAKMVK